MTKNANAKTETPRTRTPTTPLVAAINDRARMQREEARILERLYAVRLKIRALDAAVEREHERLETGGAGVPLESDGEANKPEGELERLYAQDPTEDDEGQ